MTKKRCGPCYSPFFYPPFGPCDSLKCNEQSCNKKVDFLGQSNNLVEISENTSTTIYFTEVRDNGCNYNNNSIFNPNCNGKYKIIVSVPVYISLVGDVELLQPTAQIQLVTTSGIVKASSASISGTRLYDTLNINTTVCLNRCEALFVQIVTTNIDPLSNRIGFSAGFTPRTFVGYSINCKPYYPIPYCSPCLTYLGQFNEWTDNECYDKNSCNEKVDFLGQSNDEILIFGNNPITLLFAEVRDCGSIYNNDSIFNPNCNGKYKICASVPFITASSVSGQLQLVTSSGIVKAYSASISGPGYKILNIDTTVCLNRYDAVFIQIQFKNATTDDEMSVTPFFSPRTFGGYSVNSN